MRLLRGARRPDQRGAVAVLVAAMLSVLLIAAAFAIDLNMQRVAARDAQATADLIALDMARELTGGARSTYSVASLDAAFRSSRDRNSAGLGADADRFTYELVVRQADGSYRTATPTDTPDAVEVNAVGAVNRLFVGGVGSVARNAVATADNSACFQVGSFIAGLDTSQSALLAPLLNALFGSAVTLDAVSYRGLANANVSLLSLVQTGALGVGSVDALLELPALRVADLFLASATVLDRQGNAVQANVLRRLAATVGTPTIAVADLLDVAPGADSALAAGLNVLDLVTTSAFVIQKGRTVNVPNLGISLPGVGSVSTSLTVIEPMQPGCRNTGGEVSTAQIRLRVAATLDASAVNGLLGVVNSLGNVVDARLDPTTVVLDVNLGQAIARLQRVECDDSGPSSMTLNLTSSVVGSTSVSVSTGVRVQINDPVSSIVDLLTNLLGLGSIFGTANKPYLELSANTSLLASTQPARSYDRTVVLPLPGSYEVPQGSGSGPVLGPLTTQSTTNVSLTNHYYDPGLLGIGAGWKTRTVNAGPLLNTVLSGVLGTLTGVLNPVVQALQTQVVAPLSRLLGLQLGGADVLALRTPGCGVPRLVA